MKLSVLSGLLSGVLGLAIIRPSRFALGPCECSDYAGLTGTLHRAAFPAVGPRSHVCARAEKEHIPTRASKMAAAYGSQQGGYVDEVVSGKRSGRQAARDTSFVLRQAAGGMGQLSLQQAVRNLK